MQKEKLKLLVKNLELLVEEIKSEIYSDVDSYKITNPLPYVDYDEIFEDDD
jgi:hypothetical protein